MLEIYNITKIYKAKKSKVSVKALDGVTLKFPEKGMVFIVGKSGCGKSTLLNLLGGLDSYDAGSIIINNVSSVDFNYSDFDSYRNTYVGFIFQEYNLLKDFSVGANIGLALELKGIKATSEKINDILKTVDLEGYGDRRINELSGGQKQRVAIARALIKNPEVILADEPSGALDSFSSKQLFDTLKKLSADKLVIVVSHDLDFAHIYADRIIELSDGKVISDIERTLKDFDEDSTCQNSDINKNSELKFDKGEIVVPTDYILTEKDLQAINDYLRKHKNGAIIKNVDTIAEDKKFTTTDESRIIATKNNFFPVKSRLPIKTALKIGASNLKIKKFRLVLTILLSVISFTMFGLYDTIASYNKRTATINSLYDNKINYVSLSKTETLKKYFDDGDEYLQTIQLNMDGEDIDYVSARLGVSMKGVYLHAKNELGLYSNMYNQNIASNNLYNATRFFGIIEADDNLISSNGFALLEGSRMPENFNEIIISEYVAETFIKTGLIKLSVNDDDSDEEIKINNVSDMIGKSIVLDDFSLVGDIDLYGRSLFNIVGILTTSTDFSKYKSLAEVNYDELDNLDMISYLMLSREFNDLVTYSLNGYMIVKEGFIANDIIRYETSLPIEVYAYSENLSNNYFMGLTNEKNVSGIKFFDSNKTELAENDILISEEYYNETDINTTDKEFLIRAYLNVQGYDVYNFNVVGTCKGEGMIVLSQEKYNFFKKYYDKPYSIILGQTNCTKSNMAKLVDFTTEKVNDIGYKLENQVMSSIDFVTDIFDSLKKVFFWIGIINAVFAALLLSNFISLGIINKKQDIGVLRAIGARGSDVFKIFFSESFIIAIVNFLISAILTSVIVGIINSAIHVEIGLLVTVLSFGIRQVVTLLFISVAIAIIASFFPIFKFARKKPVDIINNK